MAADRPIVREHGNAYNLFILVLTLFSLTVMVLLLLPLDTESKQLLQVYDNVGAALIQQRMGALDDFRGWPAEDGYPQWCECAAVKMPRSVIPYFPVLSPDRTVVRQRGGVGPHGLKRRIVLEQGLEIILARCFGNRDEIAIQRE